MTAGIIGATGYAGSELIRLLSGHSEISKLKLASSSRGGGYIGDIYPNLSGGEKFEGILETPEAAIASSDIVFGALPAGAGGSYAKACLDRGISYIDLSADFRFGEDTETYTAWYCDGQSGKNRQFPELLKRSVYGLPELNREAIKALAVSGPLVIGNPGCYPTAVTLAAYPALSPARGSDVPERPFTPLPGAPVIADAVSGVTGAGREPGRAYHFPECSDSVSPYKVGSHRHTPEISRNLAQIAGLPVRLVFTPHLGPFNRGILATVYITLADCPASLPDAVRPQTGEIAARAKAIREYYAAFYKNEPFVRILGEGLSAATNRVRQSNFCDISVHLDQSGSVLIVVSAIDNMVKGAAGQAIQNMNIISGIDEKTGLGALPALF